MRSDSPYSLPLLYDIAFEFRDFAGETESLLKIAQQHLGRPVESVIDLGCGPGRHVLGFSQHCRAHGLDNSAEMIAFAHELARQSRARAEFFVGDIRDWQAPRRYDMAVCLLLTFTHLLTDDDIRQHFKTVARLLNPGGLYIIETVNAELLESDQPLPPAGLTENSWSSTRGHTTVITTWGDTCRPHPTLPDVDDLTVVFEVTRNLETERFTFPASHRRIGVPRLCTIIDSTEGLEYRDLLHDTTDVIGAGRDSVTTQPLVVLQRTD